MLRFALPVGWTLLVWWFSTGAILYLDGLPRHTYRWSVAGATLVLAAALAGLYATRDDASVAAAYVAFTCGVLAWGWIELAFLTGAITGPRRERCPADARGWRRVGYALAAIAHHEVALVAVALAVALVTAGGGNLVGLWTFAVLWAMRQSAKLNLFLGVRNLSEEFLPDHLRYIESYFRRARMNALFPFSIVASVLVAGLVWSEALAADATPAEATGWTLVGTLLALAILEHAFLVLPLPTGALWRWGLRSRTATPLDLDAIAGILRPSEPRGLPQLDAAAVPLPARGSDAAR